MIKENIYEGIANRTNGDIYIGVVGPVRTGKSTFIKNFMEMFVIPNITNESRKTRAKDELPQSSSGRTIMTTEPKFVPNESIEISLQDNLKLKTRLVDCVGYIVPGAVGHIENDMPRMVSTPWYEEQIPFTEAAEIGTRKVITDHSTLGVLVTTDGSITDLPRESYIAAEERVVKELKDINKPFVIVLNTSVPYSQDSIKLSRDLENKYDAPVIPLDVSKISEQDVNDIMTNMLTEFPITEIKFEVPDWINTLDVSHWLKQNIISTIFSSFESISTIREVSNIVEQINSSDNKIITKLTIDYIKLDKGIARLVIEISPSLFYKVLSEISKLSINNDADIFKLMSDFANVKNEYDKIAFALHNVKTKGYGIVTPLMDELTLEEPEIVRQGNKYGIKLKASAPSIHMIRADIETEVSPIVGSEKQSEDLVKYLLAEFETDPKKIWESNIFGKSLHELVNEGLQNKLYKMPEDAQMKLQETLQRIINEGSGGLICIIL